MKKILVLTIALLTMAFTTGISAESTEELGKRLTAAEQKINKIIELQQELTKKIDKFAAEIKASQVTREAEQEEEEEAEEAEERPLKKRKISSARSAIREYGEDLD
jgi:peptidoglycan hydrolase CwlO-like protein